jgi:hypothetical protein
MIILRYYHSYCFGEWNTCLGGGLPPFPSPHPTINGYLSNFSLGLVTKAKACEGASQEGSTGVTFHALGSARECEGMNPHTPK